MQQLNNHKGGAETKTKTTKRRKSKKEQKRKKKGFFPLISKSKVRRRPLKAFWGFGRLFGGTDRELFVYVFVFFVLCFGSEKILSVSLFCFFDCFLFVFFVPRWAVVPAKKRRRMLIDLLT